MAGAYDPIECRLFLLTGPQFSVADTLAEVLILAAMDVESMLRCSEQSVPDLAPDGTVAG